MKKATFTLSFVLLAGSISAEQPSGLLSLDSCRALAIRNNKELRMADMKLNAAKYERKAAFTKYLPRVSAKGAYLHTSKELSLLNDEQKGRLDNLGTIVGSHASSFEGMADVLNNVGAGLVEALRTDTRDICAAAVTLTQPIYMGGKITAYNHITHYAEQMAANRYDLALQEVIVDVDEAYWQIVSLQTKKRLAESYLDLVSKLDNDVQQMITEGVATKADGLSVKVKVNEAQVALIQVDNGLSLSRMLLCQICSLDMDTPVVLADEAPDADTSLPQSVDADVQTAFLNRPELNVLRLSADIYKEKIRLARAEFMPTVAFTGGYMSSTPSLFNGFERQFKGMWNVGIMVNVPIVTFGERIYKVKAAKAEASHARYLLEETREKVELQVNQNRQKIEEAAKRLEAATKSQEEADENLRHATFGLKEGVIPISNVLEAQTAWLSAHSEFVTAQIDLRLADLYLRKSLGTLK